MKPKSLALLVGALCCIAAAQAAEHREHKHVHWSYSGETSPAHWGDLSTDFAVCKSGKHQSPVDLSAKKSEKSQYLGFAYASDRYQLENNGHTVQLKPQKAQEINIDGSVYTFKQFHFHRPSEHTFQGRHFPMEAHFVHQNAQGNLAVVSVMFQAGKDNPALQPILAKQLKAGDKFEMTQSLDINPLLPKQRQAFRLIGSLTTPPCSENVNWVVFETPVEASEAQIKAMEQNIGQHNNRPIQPLNDREVVEKVQ